MANSIRYEQKFNLNRIEKTVFKLSKDVALNFDLLVGPRKTMRLNFTASASYQQAANRLLPC